MPTKLSPRIGVAVAVATVAVAVAVGVALVVAGGSSGEAEPSATATAASGTPGPGQVTPTGPTLSPAEQEVVDLLGPVSLRRCASATAAPGQDAAVVCDADGVEHVRVSRYVDDSALAADVNARAAGIEDVGDCYEGKNSVERWGFNNQRIGSFLCWADTDQAGLFWTVDELRLGLEVSGADSTLDAMSLFTWWDTVPWWKIPTLS